MMYGLLIAFIAACGYVTYVNRLLIRQMNKFDSTNLNDRSYNHIMATNRYREKAADIGYVLTATAIGALIGLIIRGA